MSYRYRLLLALLPRAHWGDSLIALAHFIRIHGRIPLRRDRFNDFLFWLKVAGALGSERAAEVTDKELSKSYVAQIIGLQHVVPTLAVLRSARAVREYQFPECCCIKPTHASGNVMFRRGGEPVDRAAIESWFSMSYYERGREPNYKTLRPKVIVEPLVFGTSANHDYKIYCYRGRPRMIQVDVDRHTNHTRLYLDPSWNVQPFSMIYPRHERAIARPGCLDSMLEAAAKLSSDFEFLRVDMYCDGTTFLVGELTLCPENAGGVFVPPAGEMIASDLLFS